jgi:hypothetical protein
MTKKIKIIRHLAAKLTQVHKFWPLDLTDHVPRFLSYVETSHIDREDLIWSHFCRCTLHTRHNLNCKYYMLDTKDISGDIYNILCVRWIDGCVLNSSISNILVSGFSKEIQHLSMKQGSLFVLFCTYAIHWRGMLQIAFLVSLESSLEEEEEGCIGLVSWRLDLWCKSSWILNDFFTLN